MIGRHFIGGCWTDVGERLPVEDPGTGQVFADVALATPAIVDAAVQAAQSCHARRDLTAGHPRRRLEWLLRMSAAIRAVNDSGAELLCRESGKALRDARGEFEEAARYFEYYGGMADKLEGRSIPIGDGLLDWTQREPYGVSAQIIPWNFPVSLAARSIAPALAAGNAVVIKSPELAPLALQVLVEALQQADPPPGAINLLCGLGEIAGEALVRHRDVRQIVFTGSVTTGKRILHAAAERVVPCVMELGGKSAAIVHADADIDRVVDNIVAGLFFNAGQICSAMSRVLVDHTILDALLEALTTRAESLSIGHGLDNPDLTPLISGQQLRRVEDACKAGIREGARALTGGARLDRPGYFMQPTVLTDVSPTMAVVNEEIFGPVAAVMAFRDAEEAVQLANSTEYGLVAGVFGRDLDRTLATARQLQAGQVFVNEWFAGGVETPFGGTGLSGYGREKGLEALDNYLQTRNIAIRLHP